MIYGFHSALDTILVNLEFCEFGKTFKGYLLQNNLTFTPIVLVLQITIV